MQVVSLRAIRDSHILCLETGEQLGIVKEAITTSRGDKIVSFLVRQSSGLLSPTLALSPIDILEYADKVVIVQMESCIVPIAEIAYLADLIKLDCRPWAARARSVNGANLGHVADVWFSTEGHVGHYELIHHRTSRQIDSSAIVRLERHALVVNDDQPVVVAGATQLATLK